MSAPSVLISDDEPQFGRALRRDLSRHGIDVFIDPSTDVVSMAQALQPSLILLDLLQRRDGLLLLRELKQNAATQHIPVILMSGVFAQEAMEGATCKGAMALGALAVIAKPLPLDFLETIRAFLLSPSTGAAVEELPEVELEVTPAVLRAA